MQTDTPDRILRIRTVHERTGLSCSTMHRKMESGTFPGNVKISTRCTGRHASAIAEWLKDPSFHSVDDGFTG